MDNEKNLMNVIDKALNKLTTLFPPEQLPLGIK